MIGVGIGLPKKRRRNGASDITNFITYTYPVANRIYFKDCVSAHLGVTYDIDLTAQTNRIYFGACATGSREVSSEFHSS